MSAKPDPGRLGAFIDGELGLDDQLALEAQLRDDGALRAEVEALRALSESLKRQADYHAAPPSLRRLAQELVQGEPVRTAPQHPGWRMLRSRFAVPWLAGAGGMAAVLLCFSFFLQPGGGEDALLQQEAVAGHVRASLSQHRIDVVSSEQHTVKPWLSARLDYSPPVPALQRPGLVFEGARLDYLDGRNVGVLVYRQGQHQVDHYVWPSTSVQHAAVKRAVVRGFRVAGWTQQGMRHCVVSDLNEEEFAALVTAIRQGDKAP